MLRLITTSLLLSTMASTITQATASGDEAPISLDDIEGAKAARLMKNKEDIDVQSTFHEDDIKDTGDVPDDLSARLVKNRGPITAKVTASGTHTRYCSEDDDRANCSVQFSLVAWKFAGDKGTVHGELLEKFGLAGGEDKEVMKVDVDCMVRKDNVAIVGGAVKEATELHPVGKAGGRRAYVKMVDDGIDQAGDYISNIYFDDGIDSHCSTPNMDDKFVVDVESDNVANASVSVCSKHGDWEKCLEKAKAKQAIE
eukprot:876019_1